MKIEANSHRNYIGTVTISTEVDGVITSKKTYHNRGGNTLFKFFAYCLAGYWDVAEGCKPYKIRLYTKNSDSSISPSAVNDTTVNSDFTHVSNFVALETVPTVTSDRRTVFHFKIPYTSIRDKVYVMKMFSAAADNDSDYSAYVCITNDSRGWDTSIDPTEGADKNKILIVDWTMYVTNKE